MRLQPRIRARADRDIADIAEYISRDNIEAAIRFVIAARESIDFLLDNPRAGPHYPVTDLRLWGLRKWAVKGFRNYLIFYLIDGDTLDVLRVLHGARDLPKVLEEEET